MPLLNGPSVLSATWKPAQPSQRLAQMMAKRAVAQAKAHVHASPHGLTLARDLLAVAFGSDSGARPGSGEWAALQRNDGSL